MIRPLTILVLLGAAGAGLHLYSVKQSTALLERELRDINRRTEAARERTQVLRAEWALLNEPDRLRQVVQQHLSLEPMSPGQFVRASDLDRRLPPPATFAGTPSLFADPPPTDGRETLLAGRGQGGSRMAAAPIAAASDAAAEQSMPPAAPASPAVAASVAIAAVAPPRPAAARPQAPPTPLPFAQPEPSGTSPRPALASLLPQPAAPAARTAASVPTAPVAARTAPAATPAPARTVVAAAAPPARPPTRPTTAYATDANARPASTLVHASEPAVSALGALARSDRPLLPPPVPYGGGGLISAANAAPAYGQAAR